MRVPDFVNINHLLKTGRFDVILYGEIHYVEKSILFFHTVASVRYSVFVFHHVPDDVHDLSI